MLSPSMRRIYYAKVGGSSVQLPEYVRRFFQYPQMDIDYTLWQMLYLCVAPSRVYRTTKYHKQTKNQWARDGTSHTIIHHAYPHNIILITPVSY